MVRVLCRYGRKKRQDTKLHNKMGEQLSAPYPGSPLRGAGNSHMQMSDRYVLGGISRGVL